MSPFDRVCVSARKKRLRRYWWKRSVCSLGIEASYFVQMFVQLGMPKLSVFVSLFQYVSCRML